VIELKWGGAWPRFLPHDNLRTAPMEAIIKHFKQFVDRDALRANLKLTVDERLNRLSKSAAEFSPRREPPSPEKPWESVSDCGPARTKDPVIELFKRDIDRTLLRANLMRSMSERCQALASMALLVDELRRPNETVGETSDRIRQVVETTE